ncbi:MAG: DUF5684 domain-containing protein [Thermoleophilia bacterium]
MDTFTIGFVPVLFAVAAYVYYSFSLMTIASKTSTANGWFAWVPFLNLYLMCKIAGRPGWWLLLVPLVNIIVPGYLAFTDHEVMTSGRPIHH